jgi:hypothetical protein
MLACNPSWRLRKRRPCALPLPEIGNWFASVERKRTLPASNELDSQGRRNPPYERWSGGLRRIYPCLYQTGKLSSATLEARFPVSIHPSSLPASRASQHQSGGVGGVGGATTDNAKIRDKSSTVHRQSDMGLLKPDLGRVIPSFLHPLPCPQP